MTIEQVKKELDKKLVELEAASSIVVNASHWREKKAGMIVFERLHAEVERLNKKLNSLRTVAKFGR